MIQDCSKQEQQHQQSGDDAEFREVRVKRVGIQLHAAAGQKTQIESAAMEYTDILLVVDQLIAFRQILIKLWVNRQLLVAEQLVHIDACICLEYIAVAACSCRQFAHHVRKKVRLNTDDQYADNLFIFQDVLLPE